MCVSSSARGRKSPPSAASTFETDDSGPGSTSTSPMRQQQMTRSSPLKRTSIGSTADAFARPSTYLHLTIEHMSDDARSPHRLPEPDRPWMMRTYAGHSTAEKSNELYRGNLAKGQTGLSIAFDLPTQTGYDADHELARGEVGKVGVPVAHRGDMKALLDDIPLDKMNTSMTINATAAWLLGLYIVTAEEEGVAQEQLQGTTQNDIIKEYLSRGTYAFPP